MLMLFNPAKSDKLSTLVERGGVDAMSGPYFAVERAMSIFLREGV